MRGLVRLVGGAVLIATLLGMGVLAAQRYDKVPVDRGRPVTSAPLDSVEAQPRLLTYEGPGVMSERYDGLLMFARDVEGPWAMSFDLQWDAKRVEAADLGQDGLVDITGWFEVSYDANTNVLKVHATAEDREVFEAYWLRPRDPANALAFEAYVDEFFEFMHTGQFREDPTVGTIAEEECPGGSCECSCGNYKTCKVCCPPKFFPDCNCDTCRCKCIQIQSM